ncbi:MAG: transcriptional repressor LexA [bacterium]
MKENKAVSENKIVKLLETFIKKYDSYPTLLQVKESLKLRSTIEINKVIRSLEKRDIIRVNFITKAIELNQAEVLKSDNFMQVPLLGKIAAGKPIEAIVDEDNRLTLPSNLTKNKEVFALKVSGDSMIDSYLLSDDIVICERTNTARNGDMVVALFMDNTATLKMYFKEKDQIRLQPMNEKYPPIYTKKVTIQGKVVSLVREYMK